MNKTLACLMVMIVMLCGCGGGDKAGSDKAGSDKAGSDKAAGSSKKPGADAADAAGSADAAGKTVAKKDAVTKPAAVKPVVIDPSTLYGGILVIGDSLSSAENMDSQESWVGLLRKRLEDQGAHYPLVNSSMSGERSSGALRRLGDLLQKHRPRLVILETGSEDFGNTLPPAELRSNLGQMVSLCKQSGAYVLVLGVVYPPSHGNEAYVAQVQQVYADVATVDQADVDPSFLDKIADNPTMMQHDGFNPNAAAQPILLANLWPRLEKAIQASGVGTPLPAGFY